MESCKTKKKIKKVVVSQSAIQAPTNDEISKFGCSLTVTSFSNFNDIMSTNDKDKTRYPIIITTSSKN